MADEIVACAQPTAREAFLGDYQGQISFVAKDLAPDTAFEQELVTAAAGRADALAVLDTAGARAPGKLHRDDGADGERQARCGGAADGSPGERAPAEHFRQPLISLKHRASWGPTRSALFVRARRSRSRL
jgi:hypothetical protein